MSIFERKMRGTWITSSASHKIEADLKNSVKLTAEHKKNYNVKNIKRHITIITRQTSSFEVERNPKKIK